MTLASVLLRATRVATQLSQRELALYAHTSQSSISKIENAEHDITVRTLDNLARSMGSQVVLLPTLYTTAETAAIAVKQRIANPQLGRVDLAIWDLTNDLANASPNLRAALTINPAPLIGDSRYDAWIAGLVEYRLDQVNIPAPTWTTEIQRYHQPEWPVCNIDSISTIIRHETPSQFLRHGILITEDDLINV